MFSAFLIFFLGIFSSLTFSSFNNAQAKSSDTNRKNDINTIYQKLEEHYNEYGEYPTTKELENNYEEKLPGIDDASFIDENGVKINQPNSEYTYLPIDCSAIGCGHFVLSAKLSDGKSYSKPSLN